MDLTIPHKRAEIVVSDESTHLWTYKPSSADNFCGPGPEYCIDNESAPTSRHRVVLKETGTPLASLTLLASGGASGVHTHSAFIRGDILYIAVGAFVCALMLPNLKVLWHVRVDTATCFGVYDSPQSHSIISHGELDIARLNYDGRLLWSQGGMDIFSEGFELHDAHVEAVDFNQTKYRFELETGKCTIIRS